jgi:hypothetical protein
MKKSTVLAAVTLLLAIGSLSTASRAQEKKGKAISEPVPLHCPASAANACAAMNAPGSDTCSQYQCVAQWKSNVLYWSCVTVNQPQSTQCHNINQCVEVGSCNQTGGCVASPQKQMVCQQTATATRDQIKCWCVKLKCDATLANGDKYSGNVSTMCTQEWITPNE